MTKAFFAIRRFAATLFRRPFLSVYDLKTVLYRIRGKQFELSGGNQAQERPREVLSSPNPLAQFFESRQTGPGIFKWTHYFEIYHRHLSKFIGQSPNVLEIGIYSGGSLDMWRQYFGEEAQLYGVDIQPACRAYETRNTSIIIGDQGDHSFWKQAKKTIPALDVVIDDGGHLPEQQIVTFEALLPHLCPGGVYICEDIHGEANNFAAFIQGVADGLNAGRISRHENEELSAGLTSVQAVIHAVHQYPFVAVIEKRLEPRSELRALRHGTEWQPFR